jgi:hypothetical protein
MGRGSKPERGSDTVTDVDLTLPSITTKTGQRFTRITSSLKPKASQSDKFAKIWATK